MESTKGRSRALSGRRCFGGGQCCSAQPITCAPSVSCFKLRSDPTYLIRCRTLGLRSRPHGPLLCEARRRRDGLVPHRPHQYVHPVFHCPESHVFLVTPFDVVKTRLQTQPSRTRPQLLFPDTCCQTIKSVPCVRNTAPLTRSMSSLVSSHPGEVVCIWKNGLFKTEQVNGFYDAVRHVWRAEGIRGLWKGAGTSL